MLQLPIRQLLGKGSALCVWAQAFPGGMGHWHRCVLWSGPLRSQYATACRPSVGNRSESLSIAFLLKNYQFQLTIVFSKVEECCFHCLCRVHSPLHKLDQLSILPLQHQAEVKCSLRLFGHQFFSGGDHNLWTSCTGVCGSILSRWCVALTWEGCSFTQL
jgi:hypothetical protein